MAGSDQRSRSRRSLHRRRLTRRDEVQQRVGFDRPSVREPWLLKSTELTFVIECLLWNALLSFVLCRPAALVGQMRTL
jgi:hypothetical protein